MKSLFIPKLDHLERLKRPYLHHRKQKIMLKLKDRDLSKLILIGDRLLIKPSKPTQRTDSGLYLPQGIHKKEELYTGYVMKVGPGYPIPAINDMDEPWKDKSEEVKYVPLQPKPGDLAVYLQKSVFELVFDNQDYVVVPHSALLFVIRDEELVGL